ncbi:MAG: chloride channel protein, partial [Pseudomonadota bacterium]
LDFQCWRFIEDGTYIDASATLEDAMPVFERTGAPFLPVVRLAGKDMRPNLVGALFHVDALRAYNRAMAEVSEEEHS